MTLRVIAHLTAKPDKIEETKALCKSLIAPTRAEAGCIKYDLLQSNDDPAKFTYDEEWQSDVALNAHLKSPHIAAAFAKIPELLEGAPDIGKYTQVG
jgi:quinol monooxygenase YgiN